MGLYAYKVIGFWGYGYVVLIIKNLLCQRLVRPTVIGGTVF